MLLFLDGNLLAANETISNNNYYKSESEAYEIVGIRIMAIQ
jgi:hypothetical protein